MHAKNYSAVSLIYSHLMRSINYKMWAKYIYEISRISNKNNITVLELASGSGKIAELLKKKFRKFYSSDLSLPMLLSVNQSKGDKINCDMTKLPFKEKFDFIFSTFDSVNYLLTKKSFLKMLNSVDSCLVSDGLFTFDVSLEANSLNNVKHLNREGEYLKLKFRQISNYNRKTKIHQNKFMITDKDGKRFTENHRQKVYSFEEYFEMISESNFYVHGCYEAFSHTNASPKSERAQFILKKRK